jgi:ketosteroid isomerase-like protein
MFNYQTHICMNPLETDKQFFHALIAADLPALQQLLADDFILIDVMQGDENTKGDFLAVVQSGMIKFESVLPAEQTVRVYGNTAVIIGRTEMKGKMGGAPFAASSRYTHVYVLQSGAWRMVSAQGTSIAS